MCVLKYVALSIGSVTSVAFEKRYTSLIQCLTSVDKDRDTLDYVNLICSYDTRFSDATVPFCIVRTRGHLALKQ